MKKRNLLILLLSIIALPSCSNGETINEENKELSFESCLKELQKGYEVSGQIVETKRYFKDDSYEFIDDSRETETKHYSFDFTYTDSDEFTGVHRNLYSYDNHDEPHMILDENLYNKDGWVRIRYVGYENEMLEDYAYDDSGNARSYGASDLINPFLFTEESDFTFIDGSTFKMSDKKVSQMLASMFASIDVSAFSGAITRNVFDVDENGMIDTMYCMMEESYKALSTASYGVDYVSKTYTVNLNFSDIGVADSKSKLTLYEETEENKKLRTIFDKMAGQNLRVRRVDHTWYNDDPEIESNETIDIYYCNKKVFYQVYSLDEYEEITNPRDSDFLLMNPTNPNGDLYPYVRNYDGTWSRTSLPKIDRTTYENYFPILSEISHKIFHYDATRDVYYLDEPMALYWILDGCFLPLMAVSDPGYIDYLNKVEVKLKDNGDIEYARCEYYHEQDIQTIHSYYELTYEYGPSLHLPYNIEEEVK